MNIVKKFSIRFFCLSLLFAQNDSEAKREAVFNFNILKKNVQNNHDQHLVNQENLGFLIQQNMQNNQNQQAVNQGAVLGHLVQQIVNQAVVIQENQEHHHVPFFMVYGLGVNNYLAFMGNNHNH